MKIFLILTVILISNITCEKIKKLFKATESGPREHTGKETVAIESRRARCILRYSPGACMQPASVVFTFDPLIRNCTERLGCRRSSRSNRFKSYVQCMNRCMSLLRPLTNISKIMPIDQEESARRDTDTNVSLEPIMLESAIAALEETDTENDDEDIELIRHLYKSKTKDNNDLNHVTPVNIDYIFGEFL